MSLKLVFHGGMCCGMKHIYGFYGDKPQTMQPEIFERSVKNHDINGEGVRSGLEYFSDKAPRETAAERLDRYIKFLKKNRPQGIVEVCLGNWGAISQQPVWHDELIKRGFKLVNQNYNSNSGNEFYVYHLNINE